MGATALLICSYLSSGGVGDWYDGVLLMLDIGRWGVGR